jgi:hypothetical protein
MEESSPIRVIGLTLSSEKVHVSDAPSASFFEKPAMIVLQDPSGPAHPVTVFQDC